MKFHVTITARAEADIEAVLGQIQSNAPTVTARWYGRLQATLRLLEFMPQRFSPASESHELGIELRELLFGKRRGFFRILFTVSGDTVHVLHIRRGSRGPVTPDDLS